MILAHIGGVPVEETVLLWLASGTGSGLLLARAWLARQARRLRC